MARRSSSTTLVDDLVTWPWWSSLLLGVFASLTIGVVAWSMPTDRMAAKTISDILKSVWLLPLVLCSMAAIVSVIRKGWGNLLLRECPDAASARKMDPKEFESLIAAYYRKQGWEARDHAHHGPDGGIDVWMGRGTLRIVVQCKRRSVTSKVGVKEVRELLGVVTADGLDGGYLVTTGRFSGAALDFAAKDARLKLIDGRELDAMLKEAFVLQQRERAVVGAGVVAEEASAAGQFTCPECLAPMVKREGKGTWKPFFGCSTYRTTKCPGKRSLSGSALTSGQAPHREIVTEESKAS